jgi:hypothetical protein
VTAGALFGWFAAMLAIMYWALPGLSIMEAIRTAWFVEGMVGGAVLGHSVGHSRVPPNRLTRVSVLLLAAHCAAWALYLARTPRVPEKEFQAIERERVARDLQQAQGGGSTTLLHDGPWVLAGRESGFWSVNLPHYFVQLSSGGWIHVAEAYVVRGRYVGIRPTRTESYVIAAIAFGLATAFWAVFGAAVSWLWSVSVRRARGTPPDKPLQPTSGAAAPR